MMQLHTSREVVEEVVFFVSEALILSLFLK